ncbi:MAG: L,D-transpeptidase family protein [Gaiellales bacterium]
MSLRTRPTTRQQRPVRPQPAAPQHSALTPPGASPDRPSRRPRLRTVLLVLFALVAIIGAGVTLYLTMPRVESHAPTALTKDATPKLELELAHADSLRANKVDARIDGERIAITRIAVSDNSSLLVIASPPLDDGDHKISVTLQSVGLLRRTVTEEWTLTVDTTPPDVKVLTPKLPIRPESAAYIADDVTAVTKLPLRLAVAAEPGSSLQVRSSDQEFQPVDAAASDAPRRTVTLALPEGEQTLTATAVDEAGNAATSTLKVIVDTTGPKLSLRAPRVIKTNTLSLPIKAADNHGVSIVAKLDGKVLEESLQIVSTTPPPNAQRADAAASVEGAEPPASTKDGDEDAAPVVLPIAASWKLVLNEPAYEGRHVLELTATDALGATSTLTRRFIVDSTEVLGDVAGMRVGARGKDVISLHDALVEKQLVTRGALAKDRRTKTFGAQTKAAVQTYQKQQGIDVDGVVGSTTIAALTLKIVIDRANHKLTLYRAGSVFKTWNVAVGSPQYPTPAGDFQIQSMQMNPTWTPPASDWAKDAKITPPGPDNPLGTRWMGIDGAVGVHGTNNPASLGYSVSHGCIRMAIPDVEELYEIVALGTPVSVV